MKLKGLHFADVAEIQEAVTDELNEVQKVEFSAMFQKLYDSPKANGAHFDFKKKVRVFDLKKNQSKNFWTAPCMSRVCSLLQCLELNNNLHARLIRLCGTVCGLCSLERADVNAGCEF